MKYKIIILFAGILLSLTACNSGTATTDSVNDTLWIDNGKRHIFGVLHKPEGAKGIAIFVHGFNATHRDAGKYYEVLAEKGYQCYAFDFPYGSRNSKSNNNVWNMSIKDEIGDLRAIISYFKKQPGVDADNIVLIGESQGGLVSVFTSAEMSEDVSRMVLIFPALCIPSMWAQKYPEGTAIPDTSAVWGVKLGKRYYDEARQLKPFDAIPRYNKPVLIVQGDKDPIVSMEDSQRARRMYKDARMTVIKGAPHGFSKTQFKMVADKIRHFLPQLRDE